MIVTIRPMRVHDESAWKHMIVEYDETNKKYADRDWERLISGKGSAECHIAMVGDTYVGFAHTIVHDFIFHRRPCLYLADLYVRPQFRRKGIARALVQMITRDAQLSGYGRVYWVTHKDNPARALYDEYGPSEVVRYEVDF